MYQILEKRRLSSNVVLLVIDAPYVAKKAEPGQFIILRVDADGERVKAVVRGGKLCDVDGLAERFYALAALQLHGRVRAVLRVHRHGEAAQIRARGQKQILRRVHAQAGHGTPIHLRVDRAEQFGRCKRAFWQRRHRDRVGVVRREIPPAHLYGFRHMKLRQGANRLSLLQHPLTLLLQDSFLYRVLL